MRRTDSAANGEKGRTTRGTIQRPLNGRQRGAIVEQRLAEVNQIEATDDIETAFLRLRRFGVMFLVVLGACPSNAEIGGFRDRNARFS